MKKWQITKHFWVRGENFTICIKQSICEKDKFFNTGGNLWTLYAYIFPKHKLFEKLRIKSESCYPEITYSMPLHMGCSYYEEYFDQNQNPIRLEVGCDYNHLYDERYSFMENEEQASTIFIDAEVLFNYCENYGKEVES